MTTKTPRNTGKDSEDIFEAAVEAVGGFADRLSDMFDAAKSKMVSTRKPSDFIVSVNGETFYAEVKSISEKDRFNFQDIQPAQWRSATRATRAGGKYFFFLHFKAFNRWFKVPAAVILNSEKKSITMREVEGMEVFFPA